MIKMKIPRWLLIFALVASGAGAAAGTVLSGEITGEVNVSVSQPLSVERPTVTNIPGGRRWFSAANDDGTKFSAATELYQGESAVIEVPITNTAEVDHVVDITVTPPTFSVPSDADPSDYSITLEVNGSGVIDDAVRVGATKWKCTIDADSQGTDTSPFDGIKITVALGDMVPPGYYEISGGIQIAAS